MDTFTLSYPKLRPDMYESDNRIVQTLPVVPGKTLHTYFKELRITELRSHCSLLKEPSRERLRLSYEPRPGDVIKMVRAGKAVS